MADMKYIVLRSGGHEFPIIFPGELVHSEVASLLRHCVPGWDKNIPVEIASAGFIESILVVTNKERISESLRDEGVNAPPRGKVDQDLIDLYRLNGSYVGE